MQYSKGVREFDFHISTEFSWIMAFNFINSGERRIIFFFFFLKTNSENLMAPWRVTLVSNKSRLTCSYLFIITCTFVENHTRFSLCTLYVPMCVYITPFFFSLIFFIYLFFNHLIRYSTHVFDTATCFRTCLESYHSEKRISWQIQLEWRIFAVSRRQHFIAGKARRQRRARIQISRICGEYCVNTTIKKMYVTVHMQYIHIYVHIIICCLVFHLDHDSRLYTGYYRKVIFTSVCVYTNCTYTEECMASVRVCVCE